MVLCATRRYFDAGGCPAAGYFILLAQNTSNQTKGHPAAPALRAALDFPKRSGGCGTRALRSDSPRRRPPIFSENRGGAEGEFWFCGRSPRFGYPPRWGGLGGAVWVLLFLPLGPPPSSTAGPGAVGEACLRPEGPSSVYDLSSALAGRKSESPCGATPGSASSAGNPVRGGGWESPSLVHLSWRCKKGVQPPGCPRQ